MKIILALDQATNITGWAIYHDGTLHSYGKVKFEGDTIERIHLQRQWLEKTVLALTEDKNNTFKVILEDIQYQPKYEKANSFSNVQTFKTLAWVQGDLLELLYGMGINATTVFASEWKATFGIKGKDRTEQKRNAQKYVLETMGIKATQDECDAILIGNHLVYQEDKVINWE